MEQCHSGTYFTMSCTLFIFFNDSYSIVDPLCTIQCNCSTFALATVKIISSIWSLHIQAVLYQKSWNRLFEYHRSLTKHATSTTTGQNRIKVCTKFQQWFKFPIKHDTINNPSCEKHPVSINIGLLSRWHNSLLTVDDSVTLMGIFPAIMFYLPRNNVLG